MTAWAGQSSLNVFKGYEYRTLETEVPLAANRLVELGAEGWKLVTVCTLADRKYIKYLTYFIRPKRVSAADKMDRYGKGDKF